MSEPRIVVSSLGCSVGLVLDTGNAEIAVALTRDAALTLATQLIALAAVVPEVVQ